MTATHDTPPSRVRARALAVFACAVAAVLAPAAAARAAVRVADPSSLGRVYADAHAGDVIELASGSYGTFRGGHKPGTVTLRPRPGASPSLALDLYGARHLRVEHVTVREATIRGSSAYITIAHSRFTGAAVINAEQMHDAHVLLDHDSFAGIDVCRDCYEGRIEVVGDGRGRSGVTIRRSRLGPGGNADGIQDGADGVRILHNEFVGIKQVSAVHSDALQLYGAHHTQVRGNLFRDDDVAIMAPDGGDHEVITDNVFLGDGDYRPAIQFGSHVGTVFSHNVVKDMDVHMDAKDGARPSRDGVLSDNVMVGGGFYAPASKCVNCSITHNLFTARREAEGSAAQVARPRFAGGSDPRTYAGYALASGSPGRGTGDAGSDRGIRVRRSASHRIEQTPPLRLHVARRVSRTRLRRGLAVRVHAGQRVRLTFRLARAGGGRVLTAHRTMAAGVRTFRLRARASRLGPHRVQRLVLRVSARTGSGARAHRRVTIRVAR